MKKPYHALKAELVSLVHNIELNNSDWWEKTIQRLIIAILWLENKEMSVTEIIQKLRDELPITIDNKQINTQVEILCKKNILLSVKGGFKISEVNKQEFEKDFEKTEQITQKAKEKFSLILTRECPDLNTDQTWTLANKELFLPSVQQMGAKFYELLSGSKTDLGENFDTERFLTKFSESHRTGIKNTITSYLSDYDQDVRAYILRYINAAFVLEASSLEEKTIDLLKRSAGNSICFTIFVDTNFVFSLLGVHNNPFNDDATLLSNLVKDVSSKIVSKFYITPITVEETKAAIENAIDNYDDLRLSPNFARASLKTNPGGFFRKLVTEVNACNKTINARDFYAPYKVDLLKILRSKNIEFFNEKFDKYTFNQDVIDDINIQMEFEKERYKDDAKSYEKIKHDITLWHFTKEKRPLIVESPIDANYWIVTVDFRFLGFDAFKRRHSANSQPICVLPSQLIHLLQFWIPRTSNFEEVLFESWMWPVVFQDFNPDAEKISIKILEILSRFEDFQDLPEDVISQILLDNAFRKRIFTETDVNKQIELIKDALIQKLSEAEEKTLFANKKLEQAKISIENVTNKAISKEQELQDALKAKDEQLNALAAQIEKLSENINSLQIDVDNSKKEKSELEKQENINRERKHFLAEEGIHFFVTIIASLILGYVVSNLTGANLIYTSLGFWLFALFALVFVIEAKAKDKPNLTEWKPIKYLRSFKAWILAILALAGTTLFGTAIEQFVWEPIRKIFLNK